MRLHLRQPWVHGLRLAALVHGLLRDARDAHHAIGDLTFTSLGGGRGLGDRGAALCFSSVSHHHGMEESTWWVDRMESTRWVERVLSSSFSGSKTLLRTSQGGDRFPLAGGGYVRLGECTQKVARPQVSKQCALLLPHLLPLTSQCPRSGSWPKPLAKVEAVEATKATVDL